MGNNIAREALQFPSLSKKIQLDRKNVLGQGNSIVFRGTYMGHEVAVKRIMLDPSSSSIEDREVASQIKLHHKNVLKIFAVTQNADFRYREYLSQVMIIKIAIVFGIPGL